MRGVDKNIRSEVYAIVSEIFEVPTAQLHDALIWDEYEYESFALVELIIGLQEEFEIQIGLDELIKLKTLGDVVELVGHKKQKS